MIITRNTVFRLLSNPNLLEQLPQFAPLVSAYRTAKNAEGRPGCGTCSGSNNAMLDVASQSMVIIAGITGPDLPKLKALLGDNRLYMYKGQPPVLKEL